jgi:uncharacterized protein YodC (DUF2158 family)
VVKTGDTVRLKSGGPIMTVVGVNRGKDGADVWTLWFGFDGKLHDKYVFDELALELAEVPK